MLGKTHLAIGVTSGLGMVYLSEGIGWLEVGLTVACAGAASLLPDLDAENSKLNNFFFSKMSGRARSFAWGAIGALLILAQILLPQVPFWVLLTGIFFVAVALAPHRTVTHSLLMTIYVGWVVSLMAPEVATAVVVGYASHLVADMLTVSGVPLLWPLPWRFSISKIGVKIKTGSWVDTSLGYLCWILSVIGGIYLFL